jgi:hypothetical protein
MSLFEPRIQQNICIQTHSTGNITVYLTTDSTDNTNNAYENGHRHPLDVTVFIIVVLLLEFYVLYQIVSLGDQLITLTPKQR